MKITYALLPALLAVVSTHPLMGRPSHADTTKTEITTHAMSGLMGKPTLDATVEGLRFTVWLMTQEQHNEMMKGQMGQMMMVDERGGDVGKMEMRGTTDTTMGMREDTRGTKHDNMDRVMMDSMSADTHHIMLDVADATAGKEVASASVMVLFPSARNFSVDLKPMMSHFGGALALNEKGEYRFTVSARVGGVSRTTQFPYAVR